MIGYTVVATEPFTLVAGAVVDRHLELSVDAIGLEGITAEVRPRCEPRPEATRDGQRLWEQAKTALTAVALTHDAPRIRFLARTYERDVETKRGLVIRDEVDSVRVIGTHPFRSRRVEALLAEGFSHRVGDSIAYDAPDARALLSDAFLSTHCFWAVEGEDGRVGLAFEPLPARRGLAEIKGTLWLDRETAELELLELEYTHLPPVAWSYDYGGEVVFERLDNGAWIVGRRRLRLPQPMLINGFYSPGVHEAGGEVLEVGGLGTRSFFEVPAGAVAGRLVSESGLAIEGALVYLSGTAYADSTDVEGDFHLAGVRDGRYALAWHHAELTPEIGIAAPRDVIVEPDDTLELTLTAAGAYAAVNLVSPAAIELIEVYAGAVTLPAEFAGATGGCGVIAIWTRRGT